MNNQANFPVSMRQRLVATTQTGIFLAVLLAVQLLGMPNFVTGALVNGIFIFVLLQIGLRHALLLALLSPIGGIMSGHLPAPLYPLLPIIICGNFLLIGLYKIFYRYSAIIRLVMPSAIKGLLIGWAGTIVIHILNLSDKVKWFIMPVLGIQFFTAIVGLIIGEKAFQAFNRDRLVD